MPDQFEVEFWLPNNPDTQGAFIASFGRAAKIGDETYELIQLSPTYPTGLKGPTLRVKVVFKRIPSSQYTISFDQLFRGAFSPWPFGR